MSAMSTAQWGATLSEDDGEKDEKCVNIIRIQPRAHLIISDTLGWRSSTREADDDGVYLPLRCQIEA